MDYYEDYDDLYEEEEYSSDGGTSVVFVLFVVALIAAVFALVSRASQENAKISWYDPALLGTNCSQVVGGTCVSNTASGMPWQPLMGWACACPREYPFWTVFIVNGRPWVCLDRGGAINRIDGSTVWLDLMSTRPPVPFGTVVKVIVIK